VSAWADSAAAADADTAVLDSEAHEPIGLVPLAISDYLCSPCSGLDDPGGMEMVIGRFSRGSCFL
jgi:hypothetical protein